MSEDNKDNGVGPTSTLPRRTFLRNAIYAAGVLIGTPAALKGLEIGATAVKAVWNALEQSRSHTTDAQKQAIKTFNDLEAQLKQHPGNKEIEEKIIRHLYTDRNGAILRSIPEPPNKDTDMDKNNFVVNEWKAGQDYALQEGAILVTGKDPNNVPHTKADWYFIATQRDPQTHEVTGGYFSFAGNFTKAITSAEAK